MNRDTPLAQLQANFLASSSTSIPLAGTLYWLVVALASLRLPVNSVAFIVLVGSGMILPAGFLIDKLRGTRKADPAGNPLLPMYIKSTAVVILTWPLVILAAHAAKDPTVIVLGGAVLMALVWIPYGAFADDRVGMIHAVGRCLACYAAFVLVPAPHKVLAICLVVVAAYGLTFLTMKRPA